MANKPNWEDAPKWAQFLAQDKDGQFWWYKEAPSLRNGYWSDYEQRTEANINPSLEVSTSCIEFIT